MIEITEGYLRFRGANYAIFWRPDNPNSVKIGCQRRTIAQWGRLSNRYGRRAGYTEEEIAKTRKIIQVIKGIRDAIK